jgi:hypothetical protein
MSSIGKFSNSLGISSSRQSDGLNRNANNFDFVESILISSSEIRCETWAKIEKKTRDPGKREWMISWKLGRPGRKITKILFEIIFDENINQYSIYLNFEKIYQSFGYW